MDSLLPLIIVCVVCVSGSSDVIESSQTYKCCGRPTIQFNQNCRNNWDITGKPFAYTMPKHCIAPCKKIQGGEMTLDSCVNVNVTVLCTVNGVIEEARILYYNQPCSASVAHKPGNLGKGLVGLMLLLVGILFLQ